LFFCVDASCIGAVEARAERQGTNTAAASETLSSGSPRLLIAQSEGTITPEKIRGVVEIRLRQKWQPVNAADGSTATVKFAISASGQVGAATVASSAGVADFDNACIDAINRLGSLPALPSYLGAQIPFVAKFHAGKAAWVELIVDGTDAGSQQSAAGGASSQSQPSQSSATATPGDLSLDALPAGTSSGGTGQSGWTQPSSSASTGQSGWTQPSGSTAAQSDWTLPSGTPAGWTQQQGGPLSNGLQAQQTGSLDNVGVPQGMPPHVTTKPPAGKPQPPVGKQAPPVMSQPATKKAIVGSPVNNQQGTSMGGQPAGLSQSGGNPMGMPNQMQGRPQLSQEELGQQVVLLNNKAVVAIADNNYELAIKHLEEALSIDPKYQQARANLAIAYNNFGLQLKDRPEEAIKVFHKAFALDPSNEKTKVNLETIISYMGKNAKVFKDRLDLGNRAIAQGDNLGARIEYEAALAIKPDPIVQQKLYALVSGTSPNGTPDDPRRHHGVRQNTGLPQQGSPQGRPVAVPGKTPPKGSQTTAVKSPAKVTTGGATPVPKVSPGEPGGDTTDGVPPGGVSQSLDTMYRNLKNLEVKTFGKPYESDDILSRLSRLEKKMLGKVQAGKPMRRLDALLMMQ
jgi:TonB family protein